MAMAMEARLVEQGGATPATQLRQWAGGAGWAATRISSSVPMPMQMQMRSISLRQQNWAQRGHLETGATASSTEGILIDSDPDLSLQALRQKLESGEWEAADALTRQLLCALAGPAAAKRKWVYFSEVQFIPESDLKAIDSLWRSCSGDKFGYSVQRRIWKSCNRDWDLFFRKVGWTRALDERNDAYKKFPTEFCWDASDSTPEGHLPLTNALRGTQLLEGILCHPAFDSVEQNESLSLKSSLSLF